MKHGPIALIDEEMPVVFIAPHDSVFDKVVSNIQEVKARGGKVIVHHEPATSRCSTGMIDYEIRVPQTIDMLYPILTVDAAAAAGVLHRGEARAQRRPAAEPGEVGDGRVSQLWSSFDVAVVHRTVLFMHERSLVARSAELKTPSDRRSLATARGARSRSAVEAALGELGCRSQVLGAERAGALRQSHCR